MVQGLPPDSRREHDVRHYELTLHHLQGAASIKMTRHGPRFSHAEVFSWDGVTQGEAQTWDRLGRRGGRESEGKKGRLIQADVLVRKRCLGFLVRLERVVFANLV